MRSVLEIELSNLSLSVFRLVSVDEELKKLKAVSSSASLSSVDQDLLLTFTQRVDELNETYTNLT